MGEYLHKELEKYSRKGVYPFHMPGHKRNIEYVGEVLTYEKDITEIKEFDDLHHADGIIKAMELRASRIFKSEITHCLVNGSTVGNIAAIMGTTNYGDKIIIARNCHNSIHTAITLNNLNPIYVYPETIEEYGICGEVYADDIQAIIERERDIKAVVIVSPTYEGVISNIKEIADTTHKYGIPLIVDEAHGAHLGLSPYLHNNSNMLGADIVIHSIHKTLPALTQTALLHMNGELVDKSKVKKYLRMLQSSSPSYILMAGISRCLELLDEEKIDGVVNRYIENIEFMRMKLNGMTNLKLVESNIYDKGKVVISTTGSNITSKQLFELLKNKYSLELEMDGLTYVIAMTSIADTTEGIDRLTTALLEIDSELDREQYKQDLQLYNVEEKQYNESDSVYLEQRAFHESMELKRRVREKERKNQSIAELFVEEGLKGDDRGEKSESFYYLYPPGIPLIVPGEIITAKHKILMEAYKKRGYTVRKN